MLCPAYAVLTYLHTWHTDFKNLSSFCSIFFFASVLRWPRFQSPGFRPASYAGNTTESTLCASHCPTPGMCWRRRVHTGSVTLLHSSLWPRQALMLTQLFLNTLYFCKFVSYAKFSGVHASSGIIKNTNVEVQPRLKLMNKSACRQLTYVHFPERARIEEVRWKKKTGEGRRRDIWD